MASLFRRASFACALLAAGCAAPALSTRAGDMEPASYEAGAAAIQQRLALTANTRQAKNVVLMIGDGMGISTLTAARIYAGQKAGKPGEEHVLTLGTLPYSALIKTYNTDQQVSDSAGTATAMLTGLKTRAGVLNTAPSVGRGNCPGALQKPLTTLSQRAIASGRAAGVVTTARLTHATPAVMYAVSPDRNWESKKTTPSAAKAAGCSSIAEQLIEAPHGLTIAMGGGRRAFDDDMIARWPGNSVATAAQMRAATTSPLLGLFAPSHMPYAREKTPSPSLAEMTAKALEMLSANETGFFLMVEGGRIDHGHHAGRAELALEEVREFDKAVQLVLDSVDISETLILVTADHSHTLTISGYPTRGNDILGAVVQNNAKGTPTGSPALARDGLPYTTLGYMNGPGAKDGLRDPAKAPAGSIIRQPALIPTSAETHAGEDVALLAAGPWAHLVGGILEQHVIYHLMAHAMGIED